MRKRKSIASVLRRAEARRRLFRKSRLDRYRAELVAMKQAGASCADLAEWLRVTHRCKINRSSIDRYLKKLPELNNESLKTEQSKPQTEVKEKLCHVFDQPNHRPNMLFPGKLPLGLGRHDNQDDGRIHSVGTARGYEQALKGFAEYIQNHHLGDLPSVTVQGAQTISGRASRNSCPENP